MLPVASGWNVQYIVLFLQGFNLGYNSQMLKFWEWSQVAGVHPFHPKVWNGKLFSRVCFDTGVTELYSSILYLCACFR